MQSQMKTVLIVDDIPFVRKTLKQILNSHGFKVIGEATNGEEAVQLYAETRPDVVTMDLVMPTLNGVEAIKRILQLDSSAKIVILSSMMQENLITEAILAGAKDYIVKPFQTDEVLKVMHAITDSQSSNEFKLASGAS